MESNFLETRVYEHIHDWDEDDDEERIKVRQDIVWHTADVHHCSLRCQIVRLLTICKPWDDDQLDLRWNGQKFAAEMAPKEDFARKQATSYFIYQCIIKDHPNWFGKSKLRRLHVVPESWLSDILALRDRSDEKMYRSKWNITR
jgi:hypothetical protein